MQLNAPLPLARAVARRGATGGQPLHSRCTEQRGGQRAEGRVERSRWPRALCRSLETALGAVPSTYATVTGPSVVTSARNGAWRSRNERADIPLSPGPVAI